MKQIPSTSNGPSIGAIDAYRAFRETKNFGSLDGLRALSVVAVIWHHTMGHAAGLPTLLKSGHHGVTLFFAISGFLIVTLLLREHERNGTIDLRAFYMRRVLRIFPLYFAVLALYVLVVTLLEPNSPAGIEFYSNLMFFLTFTSNWFIVLEGRVIFYFAWSLAAEEQFYLVWPSVQKLLRPKWAVVAMLLLIAAVVGMQWAGLTEGTDVPLGYRVLSSVPLAICFGVVLAHVLHHMGSFIWFRRLFGSRASSAAILLAFMGVLSGPATPPVAVHLFASLFVGACVYREDHYLAALLRPRLMVRMGAVSYGMYLLHMLVKNGLAKGLSMLGLVVPGMLLFAMTALATVFAASLSFRYFESYFLQKKKSFVAPA